MRGRTAVAAGLVAGVLAGSAALAGVILLVPASDGTPPPTASPSASIVPATAAPSPSPSLAIPSSSAPAASAPAASAPTPASEAFHVGQRAPPLTVPQVGGGTIDLASLKGKPVWVNFMATWCPSCQDELPLMNGFALRYADTGLVILAVDVKEDEASVAAFATHLGVGFPVGLDGDGAAQRTWGAFALPVHFWIDADGVVRDGALGGIGPDLMVEGLQKILPGVDVHA